MIIVLEAYLLTSDTNKHSWFTGSIGSSPLKDYQGEISTSVKQRALRESEFDEVAPKEEGRDVCLMYAALSKSPIQLELPLHA